MKNKTLILFIFSILMAFFLPSCEVGLGEAVDVIAPVLEIGYPADSSVIMNTFTMSGSAADDTFVALITVSAQRTSDGATVASYTCLPNILTSSWSCVVNNKSVAADGTVTYDIPDGDYTFNVTAMDSVGRSTTKSRVYRIDNTAPVVVLKRPKIDDSFGKSVKITGDISDKNVLSSLYFTAYTKASDGTFSKIGSVRQSNISGVGLDLVIAKKYDNPTSETERKLNEIYEAMLNTRASENESAEIYCVVEVADSAKEYTPPQSNIKIPAQGTFSESGFTPYGNLSTSYYIYSTITDQIYSERNADSFKLTNSDLVSIFDGSYTGSVDTAAVKAYLAQNSIKTDTLSSTSVISNFSLNPNNSPYFEVSGYAYEDSGFSTINNQSKITVTVYPGRDQIDLNEDSVRLLLKQCDSTGSNAGEEIVLVESQDNIDAMTDPVAKAAAQAVRDSTLSTTDNVKFVSSIGKLTAKEYYLVLVEGEDVDGNEIDNGSDLYGFYVQSTGKPPIIDITSGPSDLDVSKAAGFAFAGSITNFAENVTLKYKVFAHNEKDTSEAEISGGDYQTIDLDSSLNWTLNIPADLINIPANSLYLYTVSFYAKDSDGNDTTRIVRIHVDTACPTVGSMNVSPYYSFENGTYTVNGKVSVSAIVSDNYELKDTACRVTLYDENDNEISSNTSTVEGFSIELADIDTSAVSLGSLEVGFTPKDTAGNQTTENYRIVVDQSTDRPTVSFSNLDESVTAKENVSENVNLFAQTGSNKILGTITDDDRINSILFEYAPFGSSTWTPFYSKTFSESENFVTYNLSAILQKGVSDSTPLNEGFYNIRYTIVDKEGGSDSVTKTGGPICIALDNGAPSLEITTTSGELVGANTSKTVTGTASDGNTFVKVYRYATDNTRNASMTEAYGSQANPVVIINNESELTEGTWTDTITATDNGDEFAYIAEDTFGRTTKVLFTYVIDSVAPLMEVTSPADASTIYIASPYISSFRGTAEDPKYVKISDSTPIKYATYQALSDSDKALYKAVDASDVASVLYQIKDSSGTVLASGSANGTVSWTANIDFTDDNGNPYDSATSVSFYAKDGGNLESTVTTIPLVIDTAAPLVEITSVTDLSGNAIVNYNNEGTYYVKDGFIISGYVTEINLDTITCSQADASVVKGDFDSTTNKTPFTYTVSSASSGRKVYGFTAKDKASQVSETISRIIVKDTTAPTLSNVSFTGSGSYNSSSNTYFAKNGSYTLSGTTSDDYVVSKTLVKVTKGDTEISSEELTNATWTTSIDLSNTSSWTDADVAAITITAYDYSGNTSVQNITVTLDTSAPVLNRGINENGKDRLFTAGGGKHRADTYGNSTSIEVRGSYTESGSGIARVYYKVVNDITVYSSSLVIPTSTSDSDYTTYETALYGTLTTEQQISASTDGSTGSFTVEADNANSHSIRFEDATYTDSNPVYTYPANAFSQNISNFIESSGASSNVLLLIAVDNCGNESAVSAKVLNVDSTAPVFSDEANTSRTVLSNGQAEIVLENANFYVTDSASGIASVTSSLGSIEKVTASDSVYTDVSDASANKVYWRLRISTSDLSSYTSGNVVVKVTAKDAAGSGNENFTNLCTITIDKTPPEVTVNTPVADSVVNGKISISGTSRDNNEIASVKIYSSQAYVENAESYTSTSDSGTYYDTGISFTGSDCYSWTASNIDTTKFTDNQSVKFLVLGTDKAGNKTEVIRSVNVNQASDKPAITFTNIDTSLEAGSISKDTKNIFGIAGNIILASVSDDDGIESISYKFDTASDWTSYYSRGSDTAVTTKAVNLDISTLNLTSGLHTLMFKVVDTEGATDYATLVTESINIAYDKSTPTLSITTVNGSTSFANGDFLPKEFSVVGTASDDTSIEHVYLSYDSSSVNATRTTELWDSSTNTWTGSVANLSDSSSSTNNKLTYVAIDKFGYESEVSIEFKVDTVAPVFNKYSTSDGTKHTVQDVTTLSITDGTNYYVDADSDAGYAINKMYSTSTYPVNWFKSTSITIAGSITETNFSKVELFVGSATEASASQQTKDFSFTHSFDVGSQSFTLKATDKANQVTTFGPLTIYIDTSNPTVSPISATKSDGTTAVNSDSVLPNTEKLKLSITAQDPKVSDEIVSGLHKIYVGKSNGFALTDAISAATQDLGYGSGLGEDYTKSGIEVPLTGLSDGNYSFYARVVDAAGNYNAQDTLISSFTVDTTNPVVKITSHANESIVNKTITLSGSVVDSNIASDALPTLYYSTDNSTWTAADSSWISGASIENGQWSFKFDTTKINATADAVDYYFAVAITDQAGNTNDYAGASLSASSSLTEKIKVTVDQDSDRPEISFNNVTLSNVASGDSSASAMTSSNPVWIKTSTIYGTIKDDDGIASVEYSTDGTNYSSTYKDLEGTTQNVYENGSWQLVLPDGAQTIYFKVTDEEGTTFTSSTGKTAIDLASPKFKDSKSNYYGYRSGSGVTASTNVYNTVLYAKVDTTQPAILYKYYTTDSSAASLTADDLATMDGYTSAQIESAGWKSLSQISSDVFGGPDSSFYVWAKASDASGIESLKLQHTFASSTTIEIEASVYKKVDPVTTNGVTTPGYYIGVYKVETSSGNGNNDLKVIAKDAASGTTTETVTVNLDNTGPSITLDSHKDGATVFGSIGVTISGTASDSNELKEFYYCVTSDSSEPATSSYTAISDYASIVAWTINFDDSTSVVGGTSYHDKKLNEYIPAWVHDNKYGTLTTLYFWYYAEDEFGNTSTPVKCSLVVNPQADKPVVTVVYPSQDETLGGTIRITGTATISAQEIDSVWVQIDPTYDGTFNTSGWQTEMETIIGENAATYGYSVATETISGTAEGGSDVTVTGIKASNTSFWNLTVNVANELQSTHTVAGEEVYWPIGLKVFAVSSTGKISDEVTLSFNIDPNNPLIGNSEELRLVQYDSEGNEVRSKKYESDMWISGIWYLVGSIEDSSGIKTVNVTKEGSSMESFVAGSSITSGTSNVFGKSYSEMIEAKTFSSNSGYSFSIPVGSDADNDYGSLSYTIYAVENTESNLATTQTISLNYDNKAPVFTTTLSDSGNRIQQTDYTYTLDGQFDESGSGANQSGFDKIAVFFTRTLGDTTYVVDPMVSMGDEGTSNREEVTNFSGGAVDSSDGLYWKKVTTSAAVTSATISVTPPSNARKGGLCKVNDVIYTIDSVGSSSVTLTSAPTSTSAAVDIYFATALVIDHEVTESGFTTAPWSESFSNSTDDGDQMLEGVTHRAALYTWTASIDSSNILDGPLTIHFVAFDKAGNVSINEYSGTVSNNTPRIARVTYGTDNDASGVIDDTEMTGSTGLFKWEDVIYSKTFYGKNSSGNIDTISIGDSTTSKLTIKGDTKVIPEIVGGNGGLGYSYKIDGTQQKIVKYNESGSPYKENSEIATETLHEYTDSEGNSLGTDVTGSIRGTESGDTDDTIRDLLAIDISTLELLVNSSTYDASKVYPIEFKIWDKTEGTTFGTDSPCATITLYSKIAITSSSTPSVSVSPFYWTSLKDNSIYGSSSASSFSDLKGHIELEADWKNSTAYDGSASSGEYDADPKVSGIIKFTGSAQDDVMLKKLAITIPGFNSGSELVFATRGDDGAWSTSAYSDTNGWGWSLVSDTNDQTNGNVVKWEFYLNTAKIDDVAVSDVTVDAKSYNRGVASIDSTGLAVTYASPTGSESSSTITTSSALTSHYKMDVVPYITKISTDERNASGLKANNIRSASGMYSILANNTSNVITVSGFNFNTTSIAGRIVDSSTVASATSTSGLALTVSASDSQTVTITNSGITKSGYLEIFSKGVRALNNVNKNDSYGSAEITDSSNPTATELASKYYNREADLYTTKNIQLTDDRYLLMWDMKKTATKNGYYPVMIMDGDNPVFGYVDSNGDSSGTVTTGYAPYYMPQRRVFNSDGTTSSTEYLVGGTTFEQMAMAKDSSGKYIQASVYNRESGSMGVYYNDYASNYWDDDKDGWQIPGTAFQDQNYDSARSNSNNALSIEGMKYGGLLIDRYQKLKLLADGESDTNAGAVIYMSYYDDYDGSIIFRNFKIGTRTYYVRNLGNGHYTNQTEITSNTGSADGRNTVVTGGSRFYDFGVTSDNHVVFVYYDFAQGRLRLMYSNATVNGNPETAVSFTENTLITLPDYVGQYVSMAIDSSNGIHIAAFDQNDSDLKYMYLTAYNADSYTEMIVDAAGSVGNWTNIKINSENKPVIAYYNATETGGRDAIKLAISNNAVGSVTAGIDATTNYTATGWEYITIPSVDPAQGGNQKFQQVCLDFDSSGNPVVGYLGTNLEFGKWLTE